LGEAHGREGECDEEVLEEHFRLRINKRLA
jgi:hypothetical protein